METGTGIFDVVIKCDQSTNVHIVGILEITNIDCDIKYMLARSVAYTKFNLMDTHIQQMTIPSLEMSNLIKSIDFLKNLTQNNLFYTCCCHANILTAVLLVLVM